MPKTLVHDIHVYRSRTKLKSNTLKLNHEDAIRLLKTSEYCANKGIERHFVVHVLVNA